MYHGACCVNYQNKAEHTDMAIEKKMEKESQTNSSNEIERK